MTRTSTIRKISEKVFNVGIFGQWVVVQKSGVREISGYPHVECLCRGCGNRSWVYYANLTRGFSHACKSCTQIKVRADRSMARWGRLHDDLDRILLGRWRAIHNRCYNPKNLSWKSYGGRGIRLSKEFCDPIAFVDYVKKLLPTDFNMSELELDRKDNGRGYERGNLRWVSRSINMSNTRTNVWLEYRGKRMLASDFYTQNNIRFTRRSVLKMLQNGIRPESIVERSQSNLGREKWKAEDYLKE